VLLESIEGDPGVDRCKADLNCFHDAAALL
jgi:hypothetical protein